MAKLDVGPARIDLVRFPAGDTLNLRIEFDIDLDGYAEWAATLQGEGDDTEDFAVDDSEQGDGAITFSLTSDQTEAVRAGWRYDVRVKTPDDGVLTIAAGRFVDVIDPVTEEPA